MRWWNLLRSLAAWMRGTTSHSGRPDPSLPTESEQLSSAVVEEKGQTAPSDSPSSTSTPPPSPGADDNIFTVEPGNLSPVLNYIEAKENFNASLGVSPTKNPHAWLDDELKSIEEDAAPTLVLCAVCSHKWVKYIINPVVAVSILCPECGATAGMLAD